MKVIVFANQKGGVAKTTTAAVFASGLEARGKKVLAIDLDPQMNLSSYADSDPECVSIYEVLKGDVDLADAIQDKNIFDIVSAGFELERAEYEFSGGGGVGREHLLKEAILRSDVDYDYILVDTPPALNLLTVNAFCAADEVIIPSCAAKYSKQGIEKLSESIDAVRQYLNPELRICGIVITHFNARTIIQKEYNAQILKMSEVLETNVFKQHVRLSVVIQEAEDAQQSIFDYKPNAPAVRDYDVLIDEYLECADGR